MESWGGRGEISGRRFPLTDKVTIRASRVSKQPRHYLSPPDDGVNTSVHQPGPRHRSSGARLRSACQHADGGKLHLLLLASAKTWLAQREEMGGWKVEGGWVGGGGTGCQSFISSLHSLTWPQKIQTK